MSASCAEYRNVLFLAAVLVRCALAASPPAPLPPPRMLVDDGQDAMGNRTFRTTTLRQQISLSGDWDFVTDPEDRGRADSWHTRFPASHSAIAVPGTWNTH